MHRDLNRVRGAGGPAKEVSQVSVASAAAMRMKVMVEIVKEAVIAADLVAVPHLRAAVKVAAVKAAVPEAAVKATVPEGAVVEKEAAKAEVKETIGNSVLYN